MSCENTKKHPCPDCRCCQWCSEDRCRLCLGRKNCNRRKLSFAEQIALYDALEKGVADKSDKG
ncbi:MAG: hypothetical protein CXR30_14975 [Geobacter sp.]|nr:MAG: hypothetical protein CXR30_14975 [Geobacter sp.]